MGAWALMCLDGREARTWGRENAAAGMFAGGWNGLVHAKSRKGLLCMQNAKRGFTGEERNMASRSVHASLHENEKKQACWA